MDLNWIGDIANAIPQVTAQFNGDYQDSQVQIANANARAAEAANLNNSQGLFGDSSNMIYIIIAIVVIIGLFMLLKPKKEEGNG